MIHIYDQNKWFIGLMVTITIGFVSMVIASFRCFGLRFVSETEQPSISPLGARE